MKVCLRKVPSPFRTFLRSLFVYFVVMVDLRHNETHGQERNSRNRELADTSGSTLRVIAAFLVPGREEISQDDRRGVAVNQAFCVARIDAAFPQSAACLIRCDAFILEKYRNI